MDGTQIQEMYSEMDALVAALQNDNTEELKKLTGQGEGGGDRVGEAFESINNGNQNVLRAAVLELVHHRQPELRALVLGDPQAQNLAAAVTGDAQGHVNGLVFDRPAVGIADLHP